jgi:hypothetical protein
MLKKEKAERKQYEKKGKRAHDQSSSSMLTATTEFIDFAKINLLFATSALFKKNTE